MASAGVMLSRELQVTLQLAMTEAQKQADALMKPYVEQTALKLPE